MNTRNTVAVSKSLLSLFLLWLFTGGAVGAATPHGIAPSLDADLVRDGYWLRSDRASDGQGNSVFALETRAALARGCQFDGVVTTNYLFVNQQSGERHWLFSRPQPCIWRVFYFADQPQTRGLHPNKIRAAVYDITPSGDFDTQSRFRFCTGTNPCLPLRRIFVSTADGRDLTPLTPTFQILDPSYDLPSITQRSDGAIVISRPFARDDAAAFSIDTFQLLSDDGDDKIGGETYFPGTEFNDLWPYQSNLPARFSHFLKAADEPVLFNNLAAQFAIRLSIVSEVDGSFIVRIVKMHDGSVEAETKTFGPQHEGHIGSLQSRKTPSIRDLDLNDLRTLVDTQQFWISSSRQQAVSSEASYWLLEVKRGDNYHVVYEWPPFGGPVSAIGRRILEVAKARGAVVGVP